MAHTDLALGREALRRLSFLFQDGMVLSATLRGLDAIGLLEASLQQEATVAQLRPGLTRPAFGQIRVGLRTLAQAGWLHEGPALAAEHTTIRWTDAGRAVARHHAHFIRLGDYLATFTDNEDDAWTTPWEGERSARLAELVDAAAARWELDELEPAALREQVAAQLDGALASPDAALAGRDRRSRGRRPPDRLPPATAAGRPAGCWRSSAGPRATAAGPRPAARGGTSWPTSASSPPICRCSPGCPTSTAAS